MDPRKNSRSAEWMMSMLRELSPLPRMLNSPGLDQAFKIIKRELPGTTIHEYAAGMEFEDWIVPCSWSVIEGFMKNRAGDAIASIEKNLLFVAPYSEPVDGWFSKEEIRKHLTTRPDMPDSYTLEHRNAYNYQHVDWGITMPHNTWEDLPEDEYHVKIDIECGQGSMKVAEYFLEGRRPETICINAHIDELCNDDLSGCVVAMELMRFIEELPDRQYSYQMLLAPEMIGTLAFIHENPDRIANTIGMLNLETLGVGNEWRLKKALRNDTRIEKVLRAAMNTEKTLFNEIGFFDGYGNDERVYAWPTINIPGVGLQRGPFDEYHTSKDTPDIISPGHLIEALNISKSFVKILEEDCIVSYKNTLQPWLTRRSLYLDATYDPENFQKFNNRFLFNVNGKLSMLDLSEIAEIDFFVGKGYISKFIESGLAETKDIPWKNP